jgi:zinc transport system ATP-binding protein
MPSAIDAHSVNFHYEGDSVLEHVSFDVKEGSYVGILGPNGGGKTTLMKLVLGLLEPISGHLTVFGKNPKDARKNGSIGYVPQRIVQAEFSFPITVEEVVKSGLTSRHTFGLFSDAADKEAITEAMDITGITPLKSRLIGELSGGERQKVFIARSLVSSPRMLILDEPTTGVDTASQERFYELLRTLHASKKLTILLVSHDMEILSKEVQEILCVNRTVVCDQTSHGVLNKETLEALYGQGVSLVHHHHH